MELARLVARAEREQLRLGRSDVLRVTLREQATYDAEIVEIVAQRQGASNDSTAGLLPRAGRLPGGGGRRKQ